MITDDLNGRNFATVVETAAVLTADPRTIRAGIKAGEIPGVQIGSRWMVPTAWLRQQVNGGIQEANSGVDLDQLADRIAEHVAAKVLGAFAALASSVTTAGPPGQPASLATALSASPAAANGLVQCSYQGDGNDP